MPDFRKITRREFPSIAFGAGTAAVAAFGVNAGKEAKVPASFDQLCIENGHAAKSTLSKEALKERNRLEQEFLAARQDENHRFYLPLGLLSYGAIAEAYDAVDRAAEVERLHEKDPYLPLKEGVVFSRRSLFSKFRNGACAGVPVAALVHYLTGFKEAAIRNEKDKIREQRNLTRSEEPILSPQEIVDVEKAAVKETNARFKALMGIGSVALTALFSNTVLSSKETRKLVNFIIKAREEFDEKGYAQLNFDEIKEIISKLKEADKELPVLESFIPAKWINKQVDILLRWGEDDALTARFFPKSSQDDREGFYQVNPISNEIQGPVEITALKGRCSMSVQDFEGFRQRTGL